MYEKILVPLDGSELAEVALPYVEELAQSSVAASRGGQTELVALLLTKSLWQMGSQPNLFASYPLIRISAYTLVSSCPFL